MITKYIILKSPSVDTLVLEVNALLRLGWQPKGSVARNGDIYAQAMVQYGNQFTNNAGTPIWI
jgi:hypothetical protein